MNNMMLANNNIHFKGLNTMLFRIVLLMGIFFLHGCGFATLDGVVVNGFKANPDQVVNVTVIREGTPITAETGMTLKKGDVIETGPEITAAITFNEGSEILMRPNTRIKILNPSIFEYFGEIFVSVKGIFKVKTQYATAGSEGTEYLVKVDKDELVTVSVIEGSVRLTSETQKWPSVRVSLLEQAKIQGNQMPTTAIFKPEDFNNSINWINKAKDIIGGVEIKRIVPDIRAIELSQAKTILQRENLRLGRINKGLSGQVAIGAVISQEPTANQRVKAGTMINLVIEAEPTQVPNILNLSMSRAVRMLQRNKLSIGSIQKIISTAPVDTIVSQNPVSGNTVMVGSSVDVSISAESTLVPDLQEMSLNQARQTLSRKQLTMGSVSEQITGREPVGTVLSQIPQSAQRVLTGTVVNLVIEADSVLIPDLQGMPINQARRTISDERLLPGSISEKITGRVAVGTVLSQRPQSAQRVPPRTEIDLVVEADSVLVPHLIGMNKEQAIAELRAARLKIGNVDTRRDINTKPGSVLNQSPANNSRIAPGQQVSITVAAEVVVVPQVLNMNLNGAINTLSRNKLRAGSQSQELTDRYSDGTVMQQHPRAGQQVDPYSRVNLVIAEAGIRIPRFENSHVNNATRTLGNIGLTYSISKIESSRYKSGTIMQQKPSAGTLVRKRSRVQLSVATTPPPKCLVTVPNLNNLDPSNALSLLKRYKLNGSIQSSSRYASRVVRQSPRAGSRVNCGSTIKIYTEVIKIY